ncbi:MAG TPA: aminotransferase class V-fold PLP-dependent enzyme [Acidobacteriota bacterium]|nr:aminotransferase class V-fold PLP-dependent enzyme [Acidobacteriota bacterium]
MSEKRKITYINNSATSYPKPPQVAEAVSRALNSPPEMSGRGEETGVKDRVRQARDRISRFFGCDDSSRLIFCSNATDGLNLAIHGLLGENGGHAVATTNDHNSVLRPLRTLERKGLVELTIVPGNFEGVLDADEIVRSLRDDTKLLAINHLSNVVGTISPIAELAAACRQRGVILLVDAAQSAGILDIDFDAAGIDLLAFTGHKYLFGPTGIGGLFIGEGLELEPRKQGGTGVNSEYPLQPLELPIRYEAGTVNYVGIVGLDAGIAFIKEIGLPKIRERVRKLRSECEKGLRCLNGITVYGPGPGVKKGAVVSFTLKAHGAEEVGEMLRYNYGIITRSGLHCAPLCHETLGTGAEGTVRASFSFLSDDDAPERLIRAVKEISLS